jgi:predicted membrane channel-forming protein YqfA (hemolysin III family)
MSLRHRVSIRRHHANPDRLVGRHTGQGTQAQGLGGGEGGEILGVQWGFGIGIGLAVSWLLRRHWRPVDVFLTLAALSLVVNAAIYRTIPPWRAWAIWAVVLIGGVLVTVYAM